MSKLICLIPNKFTMKTIVLLFSLMISMPVWSAGELTLFDKANQLYAEGQFKEAAQTYEQILNENKESADLYFNLGNAYYKLNQIPQAILNYERALRLSPQDEDIQFNLEAANLLVVDQLDAVPEFFLSKWIRSARQSLSLETWTSLLIVSFILALVAFAFYRISGSRAIRKFSFVFAIILLTNALVSTIAARNWHAELSGQHTALIFSPSAMVKASPDQSGTDLFLLHEGTKLEILDQMGEWYEIRLINGNEGWIEGRHLEII